MRLAIWLGLLCALLQGANVKDRIGRVEDGLRTGIRITGEPEVRWSVEQRLKHHNIPAVSVAVIDGGELAWSKAWGLAEAEAGRKAAVNTPFQAASISKPIFAMAVLKLVAQGKLNLDEDVNLKLKTWKVPEHSFGKPVTLRGLLSHTAGTTVHGFPGYKAGASIPTLPQLLSAEKPGNTGRVYVDIEPGVRARYSGGGYQIAQLLVEDVTGQKLAALMQELILKPLGMKNSTYEQPLPYALAARAAHAHERSGKSVVGKWHSYPEQAAAGLWTTPEDLARALLAVEKAWAKPEANKLLPAALVKEMMTPQKGTGSHGLGWVVRGDGTNLAFEHGGANAGFRCQAFAYATRGQGAVVMVNSDNSAILGEIMRSIAAEYGWPDNKVQEKTPLKMTPELLSSYAGEYEAMGSTVTMSVVGGKLRAETPMGTFDALPESETKFFVLTDGVPSFNFQKNAEGKVTGFSAGNVTGKKK